MEKTKYIITEKANVQSQRQGEIVPCETLRGAKMAAGRRQVFCNTVMTIEDEMGRLLTYKKDGVWHHAERLEFTDVNY
jgi:hypothetical protein